MSSTTPALSSTTPALSSTTPAVSSTKPISSTKSKVFLAPMETRSRTEPMLIQAFHMWEICSFGFSLEQHRAGMPYRTFRSAMFHTAVNGVTSEWFLECYIVDPEDWMRDFLVARLNLNSSDKASVYAKFNLYVINGKGDRLTPIRQKACKFDNGRTYADIDDFLSMDYIRENKSTLLLNDTLTIKCELFVGEEKTDSFSVQNGLYRPMKDLMLQSEIKLLYNTKEFCDVTLVAGELEFPAHRAILGARSSVFAGMFRHKMKEQTQNKVIIEDTDPKVLEELLTFIYTDEAPNAESMATDLMFAADKYDIGNLRTMCENILGSSITMENVSSILSLANACKLDELKGKVICFITSNVTNFSRTSAWVEMITRNEDSLQTMCNEFSKLMVDQPLNQS